MFSICIQHACLTFMLPKLWQRQAVYILIALPQGFALARVKPTLESITYATTFYVQYIC